MEVFGTQQTALGGVIYVSEPWRCAPREVGAAVTKLLSLASTGAVLVVDPQDGAAPCYGPYCEEALQNALVDPSIAGLCIEAPALRIGIEVGAQQPTDGLQSPPCLYFALKWPTSVAPVVAMFEDLARQVPVIHGGLDPFARFSSAITDVSLMPEALHTLPHELRVRWQHDANLRNLLWDHPRRLFALTILGQTLCEAPDLAEAKTAGAVSAWTVNDSLFIEACATDAGPPQCHWRSQCPELVAWLWPRTLQGPTDRPLRTERLRSRSGQPGLSEPDGPRATPL